MKIRIQHQKLIFRLQNEDLDFLKKNQYCEETLQIGNSSLLFSLQSKNIDKETILFKDNIIQVCIPQNLLQEWLSSEMVSMDFFLENIKLIIEKDLKELRRHVV